MALDDAHWMRRALRLARPHRGASWPNPAVGACLVRDGRLIAEGWHAEAGAPHAEVVVLRAAGLAAAGATLYVGLEPCNHQGRTPPCTDAIVAANLARVVYAVADANPHVRGGGGAALARRGVEVRAGVLATVAWELNHPFFETRGAERAHITLKLALSADARLARQSGRVVDPALRRITGRVAQRRVHQLRAQASCVVVGWRTVVADHPLLTARDVPAAHQPRPVVLDARLQLPGELLRPEFLVLASPEAPSERADALARAGIEVQRCAVDAAGRLQWAAVLEQLMARRLGVVLVEGGGALARSLVAADLPQRLHLFWAPLLLGGDGPAFSGFPGPQRCYESWRVRRAGDDVEWVLRQTGLPPGPSPSRLQD